MCVGGCARALCAGSVSETVNIYCVDTSTRILSTVFVDSCFRRLPTRPHTAPTNPDIGGENKHDSTLKNKNKKMYSAGLWSDIVDLGWKPLTVTDHSLDKDIADRRELCGSVQTRNSSAVSSDRTLTPRWRPIDPSKKDC